MDGAGFGGLHCSSYISVLGMLVCTNVVAQLSCMSSSLAARMHTQMMAALLALLLLAVAHAVALLELVGLAVAAEAPGKGDAAE